MRLLALALILASLPCLAQEFTKDLTVWPNAVSHANSDPWLVKNHDTIRRMEPRLLVLNFCNGLSMDKAMQQAQQLMAVISEGSRYHGFEDPKAPAFIQYKLAKLVDLRDPEPAPHTTDGNSTKYPRVPYWKEGINFQYKLLYDERFAKYYGFKDPKNPSRYLKLNELVERGLVNEVWFLAYQRNSGAPFECTEQKPVYDEHFQRVGDEHRHSGNGGDPNEPWFGRSLRITFMNAERGPGCATESLSHAWEATAHSSVIPYFHKYFYEYAGFDLDSRWKLPVNSLYAVDGQGKPKADYPDKTTIVVHHAGKDYRVSPYVPCGGNVHFTPNGRGDYDLANTQPVMSTMEHYRMHDGVDGKDRMTEFSIAKFAQYQQLAGDCMGPWLVYWRQCMPGYKNKSREDDGRPMKNWWVFLYY